MENNKSEPPERKISGKLARIVTDFFDFSKFCFLLSGVAEMVEDAVPETSAEVQQYLFEDMLVCQCAWCQNEFLPWIQNQDPKKLVGYGIGMFVLAGILARILTDFFEFS